MMYAIGVGVSVFVVAACAMSTWCMCHAIYKMGARDGVRLEVERSLREGGKGGNSNHC